MKFLKEVLKEIKPTKEEEKDINIRINSVINRINKGLKDAKAELGGSGAKGTWLKQFDADIFVKFNYNKFKDKSQKLSDILEKHLKKTFKITRLHGSRDYFQIREKGYTFEIVPILAIKKAEEAMNITDVSPLHAKWVLKHKKYLDEIRLTKKFCKAAKVYGAESYIQGFSGYICEILTVYYKGFLSLVKESAKWKDKVIIDINNYYKNKNVLFEMNKSKLVSPLVIVDPVQADRNAAAAISKENFERFKESCKEFLKKSSKDFFVEKEVNKEDLIKNAGKNKLIFLEVTPLKGKEDIVGGRLAKAFKFIKQRIEFYDFKIKDYGWEWHRGNKAIFWYIVDKGDLSKVKKITGPPVFLKHHVKRFEKKYKRIYVENKKVYANVKRKYCKIGDLVKDLIKEEYVRERVKDIKIK